MTIKELRKATGLSQSQFCELFKGLNISTLRNWEQGRTVAPSWVAPLIEYYLKNEMYI